MVLGVLGIPYIFDLWCFKLKNIKITNGLIFIFHTGGNWIFLSCGDLSVLKYHVRRVIILCLSFLSSVISLTRDEILSVVVAVIHNHMRALANDALVFFLFFLEKKKSTWDVFSWTISRDFRSFFFYTWNGQFTVYKFIIIIFFFLLSHGLTFSRHRYKTLFCSCRLLITIN